MPCPLRISACDGAGFVDVFIDQHTIEAHKVDGRRADEKYRLTMDQSHCGMELE
jgi:hypothetical protein